MSSFSLTNFLTPYASTDKILILKNRDNKKVGGINVCRYIKSMTEGKELWIILPEGRIVLDFPSESEAKSALVTFTTAIEALIFNCAMDGGSSQMSDFKTPARVATTADLGATRSGNTLTSNSLGNINGSGIDGITTLVVNDRVLVKNQTLGQDNGIYIITDLGSGSTPWIMTRASDADVDAKVKPDMFVFVEEGTANADSGYVLVTDRTIVLNSTVLTFVKNGSISGTNNRIVKFIGTTSGDSSFLDDGVNVSIDDGVFLSSRDTKVQVDFGNGNYFQVSTDAGTLTKPYFIVSQFESSLYADSGSSIVSATDGLGAYMASTISLQVGLIAVSDTSFFGVNRAIVISSNNIVVRHDAQLNIETPLVGVNVAIPMAAVHMQSSGNTSATYSLKLQDSSASLLLTLRDDGRIEAGNVTSSSISIGFQSSSDLGSFYNTYIGTGAGQNSNGSTRNVGIGNNNLNAVTTAARITSIGDATLIGLSTGFGVTAVGWGALETVTACSDATAIGYAALQSQSVSDGNTAVGSGAGSQLTIGTGHALLGVNAWAFGTTGINNAVFGYNGFRRNVTGSNNVVFGTDAGQFAVAAASDNVYVGFQAGYLNNDTGNGSGTVGRDRNVFIGSLAGSASTSADSVFIGYGAGATETTNNKFIVQNNTDKLIYGDFSTGSLGLGKGGNNLMIEYDVINDYAIFGTSAYRGIVFATQGATFANRRMVLHRDSGTSGALELFVPLRVEDVFFGNNDCAAYFGTIGTARGIMSRNYNLTENGAGRGLLMIAINGDSAGLRASWEPVTYGFTNTSTDGSFHHFGFGVDSVTTHRVIIDNGLRVTSNSAVGNANISFNGIASGYSGSSFITKQDGVHTTNATVTTIATISTSNNEMVVVKGLISGFRDDFTESYGAHVFAVFYNNGGVLAQISTTDVTEKYNFSGAPTSNITFSGTDILIQVTGEVGKNINWTTTYRYQKTLTNA